MTNGSILTKYALFSLFAFHLTTALAEDIECKPKIGKRSICSIAKEIARESAKELPMAINKNLTIEKSFSYKNTITLWGRFSFNEKSLSKHLLETNTSQMEFQKTWKIQAVNGLCQPGSDSYDFIMSGGIMQYTYVYKDNTPYMTVDIDSCKNIH